MDLFKKIPSWLEEVDIDVIPVQVIGWGDEGIFHFGNLAEAKQTFPELDPHKQGSRFTWAMRGEIHGSPAMRFETWEAESHYSA